MLTRGFFVAVPFIRFQRKNIVTLKLSEPEMDISDDTDKTYSLLDFKDGVTLRESDPTL